MLSERDVMKCLSATGCYGNVKMTFESGPYSIDRPTINASKFAEQIESAACAERDARIAELEAANEAFGKRQEWWNARMLELEQQLEEARKDEEMLDWLDNNIFAREPDEWDQRYGVCRDGKTQMWAIFAPKGVHGSARKIIAAAIKEQT